MCTKQELQAFEQRLRTVEKQNRRLRLIGAAGLGCVVVVGASLFAGLILSRRRSVGQEHFALRDGEGKVRAELAIVGEQPRLVFRSTEGKPRVALELFDEIAGVYLYDDAGNTRVGLAAPEQDGACLLFCDASGKMRILLELVDERRASLFLADRQGTMRLFAAAPADGPPRLTLREKVPGVVSFRVDTDWRRPLLYPVPSEGRPRLSLHLTEAGLPALDFLDTEGRYRARLGLRDGSSPILDMRDSQQRAVFRAP